MKKLILLSGLCAAYASATAAPGKQADSTRVKAIWTFVENRLAQQTDIWFGEGDFPAIVNILRFSARAEPSDYDIATNLGWMLENIKLNDEALVCYVRFKKDNPSMPDAPFPEASFYFRNKAFAKVPPLLSPTIAMHPHPNSYRTLAHAYEKLGRINDAVSVWKTLVVDHPDDAAAKVNLNKDEKKLTDQPRSGR